jgi:hypothetical protein
MLPAKIQRVLDLIRRAPGHTAPSQREAAFDLARRLGGVGDGAREPLGPEVESWVAQVAERAWSVTDDDVAALRAAGLSEDAIFELTLAAALGAAGARLERGLAVLGGGE